MARAALARAEKKSQDEGFTPLFLDESGFRLLPGVVRTWAPRGQTPLIKETSPYGHVSAISAMTPQGKLYLMTKKTSIKGPDVIVFVQHLLECIPGKLLLIWDRGSIHRAAGVQAFLAQHQDRVLVEQLPAYAPELNPDEGVWRYLKYVLLRNTNHRDLDQLRSAVVRAAKRLRGRPQIIRSFMQWAGLL